MTDTIAQTAQPEPTSRRPGATRVLLVAVLGVHAVAAVAQPFLAGAYLSGSVDAIDVHSIAGSLLVPLGLVQCVVATLFWRPARGPGWPAGVSVVLLLAEVLQVGMGYTRVLAGHLPLGVAIVATAVAMFWWSLVWRPAS